MICPNCGTTTPNEALFCGTCGAALSDAAVLNNNQQTQFPEPTGRPVSTATPESMGFTQSEFQKYAQFARYQQDLSNKAENVKIAQQNVYIAQQELDDIKKTQKHCRVAAIVIFITVLSLFPNVFGVSLSSNEYSNLEIAGFFVVWTFVSVYFAFMPYGFTPICRWISNHGFFIVFTWMFIICALMIAMMLAMFIGLPYAFKLRGDIKTAQKQVDYYQEQVNQLQAEYAAM